MRRLDQIAVDVVKSVDRDQVGRESTAHLEEQ